MSEKTGIPAYSNVPQVQNGGMDSYSNLPPSTLPRSAGGAQGLSFQTKDATDTPSTSYQRQDNAEEVGQRGNGEEPSMADDEEHPSWQSTSARLAAAAQEAALETVKVVQQAASAASRAVYGDSSMSQQEQSSVEISDQGLAPCAQENHGDDRTAQQAKTDDNLGSNGFPQMRKEKHPQVPHPGLSAVPVVPTGLVQHKPAARPAHARPAAASVFSGARIRTSHPRVEVARIGKGKLKEGSNAQVGPSTPQRATAGPPTNERDGRPMGGVPQEGQAGGSQDDEDWISRLVENLWPHIREVTQQIAWEQVPPILDENRPPWVHGMRLHKFEMGKKEPDIRKVRCFRDDADTVDDVFIDLDLEWRSEQDVEISIEVLGDDVSSIIPNLVEKQLAKLFTMVVGVDHAWVKGRLRLALRPLYWRIPIVGAIQVSFTELPEFDFRPTVTGGPLGSALNALLPSVKSWLQRTVEEAVLMPYVLPGHYFYPLDPEAQDIMRPVGIMHCQVIEATKVPRMDMFGGSDTFVEAYVRDSKRDKTRVVQGKNPHWDKDFVFPVHAPDHQSLNFTLWDFLRRDYDTFSPNDEIGICEVKLTDVPEGEPQDMWLSVYSHEEKEQEKVKKGESNIELRKRDRVLQSVLAPKGGHSTEKTSLHIKVGWRRWTQQEEEIIHKAVIRGARQVLQSDRKIDPALRQQLLSGSVNVTVQQCYNLRVGHTFLKRPAVKATVKVGDLEEEETAAVKVSRRGNINLIGSPVQVDVGGSVTERQDAHVVITFKQLGYFGMGVAIGDIRFPLREVMNRKAIRGEYPIKNLRDSDRQAPNGAESSGSARLEVRWVGTFT